MEKLLFLLKVKELEQDVWTAYVWTQPRRTGAVPRLSLLNKQKVDVTYTNFALIGSYIIFLVTNTATHAVKKVHLVILSLFVNHFLLQNLLEYWKINARASH